MSVLTREDLEFQELETCTICGHSEMEFQIQRSFFDCDFIWKRCRHCRFVFQNPKLTRASLQHIYNTNTYWTAGEERSEEGRPVGYLDYTAGEKYRLRQAEVRLRSVKKWLPEGSSLLDVACASGFFAKVACDHGYKAAGVELSADLAEFGRQEYGIEITAADFDELQLEPGSLDAITIWGSDSNFYDPVVTFNHVNEALRPGGWFFFNFWDYDHFTRPLLGGFKMGYTAMHMFNRHNVKLLLERTGFGQPHMHMEWTYATVEAILALTMRMSLLKMARRLKLDQVILRIPTFSSFLVAVQKRP